MVSARQNRRSDRDAARGPHRLAWADEEIDRSGNPFVDQFINGRRGPIQMEIRAA